MKLLLHICCGPCASGVVEELCSEHEVTLFFFNPNIWPKDEYEKRADAAKKLSERLGVPIIMGNYEHENWKDAVKGLEKEKEGGSRCSVCYEYRLSGTSRKARELGFEFFATTLSISPTKSNRRINEAGMKASLGSNFVAYDFKKSYRKSVDKSSEQALYRQRYCGCEFAMRGSN